MQTSSDGVNTFDSQDVIQEQWTDDTFIIKQADLKIFRGFPSAVRVQLNGNEIVLLFFEYSFQTDVVAYGDASAFDHSVALTFSLDNELISNVSGSFNNGVLSAISFTKVDSDGNNPTTSPCYGSGDCSEFSTTRPSTSHYVVSVSGSTNSNNDIVALSFSWTSIGQF